MSHHQQNEENKVEQVEKVQIGFFVKPEIKAKLQKMAMINNRTLSGEMTHLIEKEIKEYEQSKLLSK